MQDVQFTTKKNSLVENKISIMPLSVFHMFSALVVLVVGWFLAFFVFLLEILTMSQQL